jgi:HEAT repeat protein
LSDGRDIAPVGAAEVYDAAHQPVEPSRPPTIVDMADFDATLYFLDETEVEYLRSGVAAEYGSDLRRNVLAILFDIFEQRNEPAVRDELCGILDSLMVTLLSAGQLRAVAYLLREASAVAERVADIPAAVKMRFTALSDRVSHPSALGQLLQALEDSAELPPQDELSELFEQLRPAALGTVLAWISRTQNLRVRELLEAAGSRLAASNTAELVRLIGAAEEPVALEAIRRSGAMRSPAAVAPLGKVLAEGTVPLRLAAVAALGEIGSAGAMQALERGVDDVDRDVRIGSARALGARVHRAALPRVEAAIRSKALRDADLTEKMAFFEAFGSLCGEAGVPLLDGLLNGRGFLGKREESGLRACAAMALGRVATTEATIALQRATADEKDVIVRNAVNKALRGNGS